MHRNPSWLAAILPLLLLWSCAGQQQTPDSAPLPPYADQPQVPSVMPGSSGPFSFPALSDMTGKLREASFDLADGFADGADFSTLLPNQRVSMAGSSAVFAPAWPNSGPTEDKLAYAIYRFTLPAYFDTPVAVDFSWSDNPSASSAYIALGNFDSGRWDWSVLPAGNHFSFGQFGSYIGTADECLLAVVLTGTNAAILDSIQISTPQPPKAVLVPDSDSGVAPLTVSFDGSGSSDADGSITDFEWDLDGDGLFNESGTELSSRGSDSTSFNYATPGSYNVQLRVTDNDGFQDEAAVEINVSASQPPVAALMADVTSGPKPLAVSFSAVASMDPDGSITDYEWDFDGDGSYSEAGAEALSQGDPTPDSQSYTEVGVYDVRVRVTDNDGGQDSETVQITVTNTPPTADLQASSTKGAAPFSPSVFADGSSDAGGTITDFEWDLDGDGVFNEAGIEADARGNATPAALSFPDPIALTVSVRVTDDDNAQDTASLELASTGWAHVYVFDSGNVGIWPSLAVIDGKPAIASNDNFPNNDLLYSYSSTPLGTKDADWTTVTLQGPGDDGFYPSLALVEGKPAISYHNFSTGLHYGYSSTAQGTLVGDWTWLQVDGPGQ